MYGSILIYVNMNIPIEIPRTSGSLRGGPVRGNFETELPPVFT